MYVVGDVILSDNKIMKVKPIQQYNKENRRITLKLNFHLLHKNYEFCSTPITKRVNPCFGGKKERKTCITDKTLRCFQFLMAPKRKRKKRRKSADK